MKDNNEHIHHASNHQLADLLDEIANKAESGLKQIELDDEVLEIMKQEEAIIREAAKRLRIPPHPTFLEEYMGEC